MSDEKGYAHLFMMFGVKEGEQLFESDPANRRNVLVRHIGLNDTQAQVLLRIGAEYCEFVRIMQKEAAGILGPPEEQRVLSESQRQLLPPFNEARKATVGRLRSELHAALDEQGSLLVDRFVDEEIKPNIIFVTEGPRQ